MRRCQEIVEEARTRTDEMLAKQRKKLKKEGKEVAVYTTVWF